MWLQLLRQQADVGAGLSQSGGASARLRTLSSVEGSHIMWPSAGDMSEKGKGRRLLREKADVLAATPDVLTEAGFAAQGAITKHRRPAPRRLL